MFYLVPLTTLCQRPRRTAWNLVRPANIPITTDQGMSLMAVDYSRIHRLLKILTLIQGSKGWTPKRLALECGTTERTIYRDMKMLEVRGFRTFTT